MNFIAAVARVWAVVRATEPARLAEGVRMVLAAVVATGWVTIPDARINGIVTAVGIVGSLIATSRVRAAVIPVAKVDGCTGVHEHDPAGE